MARRRWIMLAAAAVLITLIGCGGGGNGQTKGKAGGTPSGASGEKQPAERTAKFGQPYVYADKVAVTAAAPVRFAPSESAAGMKPGELAYKVVVTVSNGSAKTLDVALVQVNFRSGTSGVQAERVFDTTGTDGMSGSVAPGAKASGPYVFAVAPANKGPVTVEVAVDLQHESVTFTGAAV